MPGIYPTPTGYRVIASIGRGKRTEKAFPKTATMRAMVRWQEDARRDLRLTQPSTGRLTGDVARYLEMRAGMPSFRAQRRMLELWRDVLGPHRLTDTVTTLEIQTWLERWRRDGLLPSTCNRRRTALQSLYTVLYGPRGDNPVREVPIGRERMRPPKLLSYALFERILASMPDVGDSAKGRRRSGISQAKLRLRVLAYTGLPPVQIAKLMPGDLRPDRTLYVRGRLKGTGTDDVVLPLTERGYQAVADLFAAGATGPFATQPLRAGFRRAAAKLGRTDLTPYDLRHLFGTTMLRASVNRVATRDLMLHTTDHTTTRYVRQAITTEQRAAVHAYDVLVRAEVVDRGCGGRWATPIEVTEPMRLRRA